MIVKLIGRAFLLTQAAIAAYFIWMEMNPHINAQCNAHVSLRRDGPVEW